MRTITVTIEIEDNNYIETALHNELDGMLGGSMKSFVSSHKTK